MLGISLGNRIVLLWMGPNLLSHGGLKRECFRVLTGLVPAFPTTIATTVISLNRGFTLHSLSRPLSHCLSLSNSDTGKERLYGSIVIVPWSILNENMLLCSRVNNDILHKIHIKGITSSVCNDVLSPPNRDKSQGCFCLHYKPTPKGSELSR